MCETISFLCDVNISYYLVILLGLLTLIWALIMQFSTIRYIPFLSLDTKKNPLGFKKRIIWLELVDSVDEVFNILENPGTKEGIEIRRLINRANFLDNIFIFIYSAFNASLFYFTYILTDSIFRPFLISGIVLSIVMLVTDYLENDQIYKLTEVESPDKLNKCGVLCIQIWARLKWGAIAISSLVLSIFYFDYFISQFKVTWELIWFLLPILFLTTGVSMFLAISISSLRNQAEKAMNLGLVPAWLLSWIYAIYLLVNRYFE